MKRHVLSTLAYMVGNSFHGTLASDLTGNKARLRFGGTRQFEGSPGRWNMGQLRSITRFAKLALLLAAVQSGRSVGVTTVLPNEPIAITHWDSDNGLPPGPAGTIKQTRDG